MPAPGLHRRLVSIVGERPYASIAKITGTTPATTRRYMTGYAPSVEFLQSLCEEFEINAHWLLTGHGPMHAGDLKDHALKHANPTELMAAIARALESLTDRLDRLETFVQTQEARLRVTGTLTTKGADDGGSGSDADITTRAARVRAGRVADAVAQRPPSDADRVDPPADAGPGPALGGGAAAGA